MVHPSIADIHEADLVSALIADPYWRATILNIYGIPNYPEIRERVSLASMHGQGDGDIDILAWGKAEPQLATAIEVKRIKLGKNAFPNGRPNKLQEYGKAVCQANRLSKIGFWQVYLFVLVVVDSRSHNAGQITYNGPTRNHEVLIADTITVTGLDQNVGVIRHDFIQPMDYAPLGVGAGGAHLVRLASASAQPAKLTAWVASLV
jgi:hypothetical protein